MTATVVPINPRHWQEMLWEDQSLWDGLGAWVLAEMHERLWNVMAREDEWEQVCLLALKHGYEAELEALVYGLEHPDRTDPSVVDPRWHNPPEGRRQAWVFDFPVAASEAEAAVETSVVPRVEPDPEPEVLTRKWWRK